MIKTAKWGVELLETISVNTNVSTPIITMGFSSDQKTPSDMFRERIRKSFMTRF